MSKITAEQLAQAVSCSNEIPPIISQKQISSEFLRSVLSTFLDEEFSETWSINSDTLPEFNLENFCQIPGLNQDFQSLLKKMLLTAIEDIVVTNLNNENELKTKARTDFENNKERIKEVVLTTIQQQYTRLQNWSDSNPGINGSVEIDELKKQGLASVLSAQDFVPEQLTAVISRDFSVLSKKLEESEIPEKLGESNLPNEIRGCLIGRVERRAGRVAMLAMTVALLALLGAMQTSGAENERAETNFNGVPVVQGFDQVEYQKELILNGNGFSYDDLVV